MTAANPDPVDVAFLASLDTLEEGPRGDPSAPARPVASLLGAQALALFESQITSRHLDYAARLLRERGTGFYTIGSAGHEGNAAVAAACRVDDPALLHYRSGAFFVERARMHREAGGASVDPVRDVLLGMLASSDEPIAGGRHKVFGSRALHVIPQTSTIASHLPRALGLALAIERARKLGRPTPWPKDAIVVSSFGDASANHSTATGAIQAACHCAYQRLPAPVLFVCEDNGIGLSVPTPEGWVRAAYGSRPGLAYFDADGTDLVEAYEVACAAVRHVRERRMPAFLHLRVVRLLGHAGADVESVYRSPEAIRRDLERDPLVRSARLLAAAGILTKAELRERYEAARERVRERAITLERSPRLESLAAIAAPLAPGDPERIRAEVARMGRALGDALAPTEPLTLGLAVNRALADVLAAVPETLVFGEDVAQKGGVYGITRGLVKRFGAARVFDTILDETSILGLALGASLAGFVPVPEIQYLAYLHNAEDQLRGEAATLSFFSQGAYRNGIVVRVAGYGYQKGFGGHFHNDDAVAVLRDVPGIVVASPARPEDAAAMLRTCVAAAKVDGTVCVFLEPIALYHGRDLHHAGDGGWLAPTTAPATFEEAHVPIGRGRTWGEGNDLVIVTFGNGLALSLRAARRLAEEGIHARVLDLRWLVPLPEDDLLREARATGRVLVVDETRRSGGVSEGVVTALVDAGFTGRIARVTSADCFVPLGEAARHVLVDEEAIERGARTLVL